MWVYISFLHKIFRLPLFKENIALKMIPALSFSAAGKKKKLIFVNSYFLTMLCTHQDANPLGLFIKLPLHKMKKVFGLWSTEHQIQ